MREETGLKIYKPWAGLWVERWSLMQRGEIVSLKQEPDGPMILCLLFSACPAHSALASFWPLHTASCRPSEIGNFLSLGLLAIFHSEDPQRLELLIEIQIATLLPYLHHYPRGLPSTLCFPSTSWALPRSSFLVFSLMLASQKLHPRPWLVPFSAAVSCQPPPQQWLRPPSPL